MAIFTRTSGDAKGVVNVDTGTHGGGIGAIVATGIGKHPTAFHIGTAVDLRGETGTGGAVEAILRTLAVQSSLLAYQVENDATGQISVLVEATSYDAASLAAAIHAIGSTGAGPVDLSATTVTTAGGFKLA